MNLLGRRWKIASAWQPCTILNIKRIKLMALSG
jgi:hypothetical protein